MVSKTIQSTLLVVATAFVLVFAVVGCGPEETAEGDSATFKADGPEPIPAAYLPAGPIGDGRFVLPNGRMISPAGDRVTVNRYPMSAALHPDGDRLYVATARVASLTVIDTATMEIEAEVELPKHFGGMVVNAAGTKLWVSGAEREVIYEYDLAGGLPVLARQIPAYGFPKGLTLSTDETRLYVPLMTAKRVAILDVASGTEVGSLNTGTYPHTVAISDALGRIIVSNWGTSSASIFNLADGSFLADVEIGKNPEGIAISADGRTAYVACSDSDEVHVVDLETLSAESVIDLYSDPDAIGFGAMPTRVTWSADGQYLYVTSSGFNSIDVIDPEAGEVIGRIPTGWYPTMALPVGDTIYVLSGKGVGSAPGEVPLGGKFERGDLAAGGGALAGTVAAVPVPDAETLAEYTAAVEANNRRTAEFYDDLDFDSPVPTERGVRSEQIKRVVFILKENKTFDQVMSDLPGVNGDTDLLIFGDYYTPNVHALAREFTVCDNYYSESHESDMGHQWTTMVVANDYVEKAWVAHKVPPLTGVDPATIPESGTVFDRMLEAGINFRIWGEVVGTLPDIERLAPYMDLNYGFYNMTVSDRLKAREVIREWEAGLFPEFAYILLPNDHTAGSDPGAPTAPYYVADNDAAVGELVDWIMNSEYWPETAIFITEDDPQSGVDHVDAQRTPFTVVGPHVKRGHVSGVHYSMASMWLTIELILGLPQLTNYDRFTAPMYDVFAADPDLDTDFSAIPSNVPFEINPEDGPMADYSAAQDWSTPDQVERAAEVTWAIMKPGVPFPYHLSVAPSEAEEEELEDEEEIIHYKEMLRAYLEYAREHDLIDQEHGLVGKTMYVK